MTPELRLVKGPTDDATEETTFVPDRLIPVRIAQGSLLLVLMTSAGVVIQPQLRTPLLAATAFLCLQGLWAAVVAIRRAQVRYHLNAQRLEIERGLLARRRESIELWRVRDVVLDQSILERLRDIGTVTIFSTDQVEPLLAMPKLARSKSIYELLRDTVSRARAQGNVMRVDR